MQTVASRVKEQGVIREQEVQACREAIEAARRAERLSVNSDWLWLKGHIQELIDKKSETDYKSMFKPGLSTEQKLALADSVTALESELGSFRFLVGLLDAYILEGYESEKRLKELGEGL